LNFIEPIAVNRILSEKTESLTETLPTYSNMFINMLPSSLSGLLVSIFLIVMLLIALQCLMDIKTNDKFARNNLWVGK
jgi:hypothetical protein